MLIKQRILVAIMWKQMKILLPIQMNPQFQLNLSEGQMEGIDTLTPKIRMRWDHQSIAGTLVLLRIRRQH